MKYLIFIFGVLFIISCSTKPQPLVVGKDVCNFCQMPVADTKFGAEIITKKGKLYTFDDIGCMTNFLKNNFTANEKVKNIYTVIYTDNQKLLNVKESVFLKSAELHSPMNSGTAAFESQDIASSFLKDFPGEILTWDQLQQKLK